MKKIFYLFSVVAGFSTLVSCEKVIDVDLNSASPKYVIEGGVTNNSNPCRIKITQTKNFSEDNNFEGVPNAFVTISDNAGGSDTLQYVDLGIYESNSIFGVSGRTYYLNVKVNGETFTSVSTLPGQVNMDSLYTFDFTGFNDTIKIINVDYSDPENVRNWYRFILTVNNDTKNDIIFNNDEYSNGRPSQQNIFYGGEDGLKAGDSVSIEMQCIDKEVYNYFFSLDQTISQSAAAPTNPVSNITGGALGYFSANTVERKTIVIH